MPSRLDLSGGGAVAHPWTRPLVRTSAAAGDARRTTTSTSRTTRMVIAAPASPTFARFTPAAHHLLVWRDQICTEYCGEAFPLGPLLTPPPGEVTASIVNAV